jgi:hypothetical protein
MMMMGYFAGEIHEMPPENLQLLDSHGRVFKRDLS